MEFAGSGGIGCGKAGEALVLEDCRVVGGLEDDRAELTPAKVESSFVKSFDG